MVKTPLAANGAALTNYDRLVGSVGRLADSTETATGTIYSERTSRALAKLRDSTNQPLNAPDYLVDVPRYATDQVPNNLTVGSGTTCSDAFTADWSHLLIGIRTSLRIKVLEERYADTGHVGFLAWFRGDIQVARPAAFGVITGIP